VDGDDPGFTRLDPGDTGLEFTNAVSDSARFHNRILAAGSGAALGDVDADGRPDVYLAAAEGPNALFLNRGGWEFEEVTDAAGVGLADHPSKGAALADVNGDGDLDLLVSGLGARTRLFLNDGSGTFEEATDAWGLEGTGGSTTLALADVDGDGDLDLYETRYKTRRATDIFSPAERSFDNVVRETDDGFEVIPEFRDHYRIEAEGRLVRRWETGEADVLWENTGNGFRRVPWTEGRFLNEQGRPLPSAPLDWGLAARFHDLDGDGHPDLYVANDFESPDRVWMNRGDGSYRAVRRVALRTTSASSMAVDFADVDRDGALDFFVADMLSRDPELRRRQVPQTRVQPVAPGDIGARPQDDRNTLQVSRGDATWAEAAHFAGVAASEWTWAVAFLDVDLDGREDLLATTGHAWDQLDADTQRRVRSSPLGHDWRRELGLYPPLPLRNVAFRNTGDLRFEEVGEAWGFGPEEDVSHGIATADLDGDGDLDVVATRLDVPVAVYRNDAAAPRVAVRLAGPPPNTDGVGAVVRLEGGPGGVQRREKALGGLYLSSSEPLLSFAAGAEATDLELEVRWPDGRTTRIEDVRPDRLYEARHPDAPPLPAADSAAAPGSFGRVEADDSEGQDPWFADRTEMLGGHEHAETVFDDFAHQPLLPMKLSQLGPGVAFVDPEGDGRPDLVVGAGRGGRPARFRNDGGRLVPAPTSGPEARWDQTSLVPFPDGRGELDLLVGQSSYEASSPGEAVETPSVLRFDLGATGDGLPGDGTPVVPGSRSATGPLAAADVDGDGDLDLFVGGRVLPGGYPISADSRIVVNRDGELDVDAARSAPFRELGLVSDALFTDLDVDGDPDLVLALEWGPVRVFENDGEGRFTDATGRWGLERLTGRWIGLAAGDLNEDGRPDLVVTAWGKNTPDGASSERPLVAAYGDVDGNGTMDVLEARRDTALDGLVPLRFLPALQNALPFLRRSVTSFRTFASMTLQDLMGDRLDEMRRLEAVTLSHHLLLSRPDGEPGFEVRELPAEAQLAPAFLAAVADADGDGHDDVLLGQNFFPTRPGRASLAAGRGLWLEGDGTGSLRPVPGARSGIEVYGDVRGGALADVDGDRRVDLALSQNGAPTRLYLNRGARPGLRVRLDGPPANPRAVGTALRIVYADGSAGPRREVQAGGGYGSTGAHHTLLGLRSNARPDSLRVTWPDGSRATRALPADVGTLRLAWDGPQER
jgi:hypothetical protein